MTNAKKYKTVADRETAWSNYCKKHFDTVGCDSCPLHSHTGASSCAFAWLAMDESECENTLADRIERVAANLGEEARRELKSIALAVRQNEHATAETPDDDATEEG